MISNTLEESKVSSLGIGLKGVFVRVMFAGLPTKESLFLAKISKLSGLISDSNEYSFKVPFNCNFTHFELAQFPFKM